jgi:hypothetical protein
MKSNLGRVMGDFPRETLFSFSDRVRQQAVQLKRRDMLNPLPEHLKEDTPSLCALATMNAMEKYPELLRSDLEETERHKKVPDGYLVNFPSGERLTPPAPARPPPQPAAPGDWVGEGGRKRRSKKRRSKKRRSKKRKSRK